MSAAAPFPSDCGESETATWLQHTPVLLIPRPFFWLPRVTMRRLPNHLPTSQDQRAVAGLVDRLSLLSVLNLLTINIVLLLLSNPFELLITNLAYSVSLRTKIIDANTYWTKLFQYDNSR